MIACIEDPIMIQTILDHLATTDEAREPFPSPESRGQEIARIGTVYGTAQPSVRADGRRSTRALVMGNKVRVNRISWAIYPLFANFWPPFSTNQVVGGSNPSRRAKRIKYL